MDCNSVRDDMLDALYGEAGELALARLRAHHAECAACRGEYESLGRLREQLRTWTAPERRPAAPADARVRRNAYRLAAAAALVLALGAALRLSGASFEYNRGPLTLRVGDSGPGLRAELAALEARHRRELDELRASLRDANAGVATGGVSLKQVSELLERSQQRQAADWEARFTGFERRADAQRRYDMARISAGLSYLDGKTGQHVARTTELMGYMLRAAQEK
jgi:hypothetical protein